MNVRLKIHDQESRKCLVPDNEAHAIPTGSCPQCGKEPFQVIGRPPVREFNDCELHSTAKCLLCRTVVGTLVVSETTLFGFTEDRTILEGRYRVY